MRPVIAIIDDYERFVPGLAAFQKLVRELPDADIRVVASQPLDDAAVATLADVQYLVLIRERTRVDAALLDRLPALQALVQTGRAGDPATSHIDQAECAARGVRIIEGGSSDGHAAAELTWALILNARRGIPRYMDALEAGRWHQSPGQAAIGVSLKGQTLGILGYGRIGRLLGEYGRAFGMHVLVWGREGSRQAARETRAEFAESRDALFQRSDVLALQMRMNESSRHSVSHQDLALMKPTALLVNTSRPALIAPGALEQALAEGRPGGVALDVHHDEPVMQPGGLLGSPNVVATPHIGYVERNSYEILFDGAFEQLVAACRQSAAPDT